MPHLHTHIYIESVSNTHRSRVTSSISTNCEVYFTKPFVETRILGVAREGVAGSGRPGSDHIQNVHTNIYIESVSITHR